MEPTGSAIAERAANQEKEKKAFETFSSAITPEASQLVVAAEKRKPPALDYTQPQADSDRSRETADTSMDEWLDSNIEWILQSTFDTSNPAAQAKAEARREALTALGIPIPDALRHTAVTFKHYKKLHTSDISNPDGSTQKKVPTFAEFRASRISDFTQLDQSLKGFYQEYGTQEHGVRRFIQKIAEGCRGAGPTGDFNLAQFNLRVDSMRDFFSNFGNDNVPQEIADYLHAYVVIELPSDSKYKKPLLEEAKKQTPSELPQSPREKELAEKQEKLFDLLEDPRLNIPLRDGLKDFETGLSLHLAAIANIVRETPDMFPGSEKQQLKNVIAEIQKLPAQDIEQLRFWNLRYFPPDSKTVYADQYMTPESTKLSHESEVLEHLAGNFKVIKQNNLTPNMPLGELTPSSMENTRFLILQDGSNIQVVLSEHYNWPRIKDALNSYYQSQGITFLSPSEFQQSLEKKGPTPAPFPPKVPPEANPDDPAKKETTATETQKSLEPGTPYTLQKAMEHVQGSPEQQGNNYWVEGVIPPDLVARLTPAELTALESTESMFVNDAAGNAMLNKDVFEPPYSLAHNQRFLNGELATDNDSGIFALAAASAPGNPEQASYYQTLAQAILAVHTNNENLLEQFLNHQNEETREFFRFNETGRAEREIDETTNQNIRGQAELTPEQDRELENLLNESILTRPDRMIMYRTVHNTKEGGTYLTEDTQATAEIWKIRIPELQEALNTGELTVEQIKQIEFLGHAVKIGEVVEKMQKNITNKANREAQPAAPEFTKRQKELEGGEKIPEIPLRPDNKERVTIQKLRKKINDEKPKMIGVQWKDLLSSSDLTVDEINLLKPMILMRLKMNSITIIDEDNLAEVGEKYGVLVTKDMEVKESDRNDPNSPFKFENYSKKDLVIVDGGTYTQTYSELQLTDPGQRVGDLETRVFSNASLSLLEAYASKMDALGVSVRGDEINIVIADGVSGSLTFDENKGYYGSLYSKVAAREIVREGLISLRNHTSVSLQNTEEIFNHLQEVDFSAMAQLGIDKLRKVGDSGGVQILQRWFDRPAFSRDERIMGSLATAGMVKYNQHTGEVQYGLVGDTGLVIYRAKTNTLEPLITNPDNSGQLYYHPDPDKQYVPGGDKYGKITLEPGDTLMLMSDGIHHKHPDLLNKNILPDAIQANRGKRTDEVIIEAVQEELKKSGFFGDDISLIAITHEAGASKALTQQEQETKAHELMMQKAEKVLDRLKTSKGMEMLGKQVQLSDEEVHDLEAYLDYKIAEIEANQAYQQIKTLEDEEADKNKAFAIARGFDAIFIFDDTIHEPALTNTKDGVKLKISNDMRKMMEKFNGLASGKDYLRRYAKSKADNTEFAVPAATFVQHIETGSPLI